MYIECTLIHIQDWDLVQITSNYLKLLLTYILNGRYNNINVHVVIRVAIIMGLLYI